MKPVPHLHGCPECSCVWECMNPHCGDLDGKWCDNVCKGCAIPPEYMRRLLAAQDAHEEILHAVYVLEHKAGESDLAERFRELLPLIRTRTQERFKGIHWTLPRLNESEPDLMSDSADLHAGEI